MSADEPTTPERYSRRKVIARGAGESRAKQSFKKDCDINLIVQRHGSTGMWSHLNPIRPRYGDFSATADYQDAVELVRAAEASFMALPAEIRKECENDPAVFLASLADEQAFHRMVELGLPVEDTYEPPIDRTPVPESPEVPDTPEE